MKTKKKVSKEAIIRLAVLVLVFVAAFALYRYFVNIEWIGGMWIYLIVSCVSFIVYFILNRGLSSKEDQNDETDEKDEKRKKLAKAFLIIFAAFSLTLLIDLFDIYFLDGLVSRLGGIFS